MKPPTSTHLNPTPNLTSPGPTNPNLTSPTNYQLPGIHRGKDVRKRRQHRRRLLRQGGTCIDAETLEVAKPGRQWRRRWVGGLVVRW